MSHSIEAQERAYYYYSKDILPIYLNKLERGFQNKKTFGLKKHSGLLMKPR